MTCDMPCMSYMALYIVSMHIVNSNSKSSVGSNHWKLNLDEGKVVQTEENGGNSDSVMNILTNKVIENGQWKIMNSGIGQGMEQIPDQIKRSQIISIETVKLASSQHRFYFDVHKVCGKLGRGKTALGGW